MAGSLVAELRANITEFSAKMGEARAEVAKLGTQSAGHMEKLQTVGKAAFLGLGAAAIAGSVIAVKAAGDYQESLTRLVTGAGESEKNIKLVGDGMLHMAGQVGISAQNLSKGMFLIESAGFHGADGLTALKAAAEGARVGGADMATVADGLTTALNDYHLPASAAADVTSKLVETVSLGKTHMQDLAGSMATVLPAASAAHLGLSEVLGAMATMTMKGTPAADAATYLKQTIINLEKPSAKAASEMKALGLSSIDISTHLGQRGLTGTFDLLTNAIQNKMGPAGIVLIDSLKKSAGNTTAFQKVLANLPPTQQSYIEALGNMVGGAKSMQAALQLTGDGAKTFGEDVKAISGTTTEAGGHVKGFALTQKDLNTQLANMKAAAESVAIELGQKLIPRLTEALVWLQKHKTEAEALAGVVGGVLTVAIGAYFVGALKKASEALTLTGRAARLFGVQAAEGELAAELPLLPWIAAVALVAVAAYELYKHWDQVWGFIKNTAKTAYDWVDRRLFTPIEKAMDVVAKAWDGAWKAISNAVGAAVGFLQRHWQVLLAVFLGPIGLAIDALATHWRGIWTGMQAVTGVVVGAWQVLFRFIKELINYDVVVPAEALARVWGSVWGQVKGVLSDAWNWISPIFHSANEGVGQVSSATSTFGGVWASIWNAVKGAVQDAWNYIQPIISTISGALGGISGAISSVSGAVSSVSGAASKLGGFFGIGGRAGGGPVSSGTPYVIGENGPEVFVPGASGFITPNDQLGGNSGAPAAGSQQPIVVQLMLDGRIIAENTLTVLQRLNGRGHVLGLT